MTYSKGDRVEHIKSHKTGTVLQDQYSSGDRGFAVYVKWDGSNRPANPVNTKNLKKV